MNRREFLHALAAAPWCPAGHLAVAVQPSWYTRPACCSLSLAPHASRAHDAHDKMGLVIHSYWVRRDRPLPPEFPPISDPVDFVTHAAAIGAGGVQVRIASAEPADLKRLRAAVEQHGQYIEGIVALPKDETDVPRFESELRVARAAGATVVRTVCIGERRYEKFSTADEWRRFVDQSWRSLVLAEPVTAWQRMRLAVENHKDWRVDEMLGWLRRLSSEHVGVCIDTGNSIALLEEPHQVVEAYAPWAFSTHIKDMGVAEYDDGFVLSEVPLGDGFLDLPRIVSTLHKARPDVRLNLEMITRDPLRIPCLTPKYWATMDRLPARELADALARVRKHRFPRSLPTISKLSHVEQLRAEAANVTRSLDYARQKLGA